MRESRLLNIFVPLGALAFLVSSPASAQNTGMQIDTNDGNVFMEEVPSDRPDAQGSPTAARVQMKRPADFSELGVPINSAGHIVPILDGQGGGIMPLGTSASVTTEPLPYYGYWRPAYPYYGGYAPYRGYGYGAPAYGYGYPAVPGLSLRLGNMRVNVGAGNYYQPYTNIPFGGYGRLAPYVATTPFGGYTPPASPSSFGYYNPLPLGYIPTMYSSTGMGSYSFDSSSTSNVFGLPFSYNTRSSGSLLAPLMR
jgi:hypothetical protein